MIVLSKDIFSFNKISLLIILVISIIYFRGLDSPGLIAPGEPRYAEISKEMLLTNDWVIPSFNGNIHLEKPPLVYWMVAIVFKMFGVNEWSVRFIPVLAGLLSGMFVFLLAKRLYDKKTAWIAILILLSSYSWAIFSQFLLTDIIAIMFMIGSLYYFWCYRETYQTRYSLLTMVFFAMAFLTRGFLGIFFPFFIIFVFVFWKREWLLLYKKAWFLAVVLFFIIIIPWHILVELRVPGFLYNYSINNHIGRFLGTYPPGGNESLAFFEFWGLFFGGFFPWSLLVPLIIYYLFIVHLKQKTNKDGDDYILIWILVVAIFISISSAKLERYFLPLLPVLAIVLGRIFIQDKISFKKYLNVFFYGILVLGIMLFLTWLFKSKLIPMVNYIYDLVPWIAINIILGSLVAIRFLSKDNVRISILSFLIGVMGSILIIYCAIDRLDPVLSLKKVAHFISEENQYFDKIIVDKSYQYYEGIYYYSNNHVVVLRQTNKELETKAKWDGAIHPHIDYNDLENLWSSTQGILLITKYSSTIDYCEKNFSERVFVEYKFDPFVLISNIPIKE